MHSVLQQACYGMREHHVSHETLSWCREFTTSTMHLLHKHLLPRTSVLATTSRPEVPLSRRCTMPGRRWWLLPGTGPDVLL